MFYVLERRTCVGCGNTASAAALETLVQMHWVVLDETRARCPGCATNFVAEHAAPAPVAASVGSPSWPIVPGRRPSLRTAIEIANDRYVTGS